MLITLIGRLSQFALMLVNIKVMTSLLAPAQYGLMSLYLAVNVFFGLVFVNPVGTFINRHLQRWRSEGLLASKFRLFFPYWLALALACFVLLFVSSKAGWFFEGETVLTLFICSALVLSSTLFNTLVPSLNLLGHDKPFVLITLVTHLLGLLFSFIAVSVAGATAGHWLAGVVLSQVVGVAVSLGVYRRLGALQLKGTAEPVMAVLSRSVFPYAWPVLLYTLLVWGAFQSYRFVVESRFSLAELGLLVAGYSVAIQVIAATEQIANTWFLPRFYAECDSPDPQRRAMAVVQYVFSMAVPVLLAAFAVLTGADLLVQVMLGSAYQGTAGFVVLGVLIELFRVLANATGLRFHQTHQTRRLIGPAMAALVLVALPGLFLPLTLGLVMVSMIAGAVLLLVLMFDKPLLLATWRYCLSNIVLWRMCVPLLAFFCLAGLRTHVETTLYFILWGLLWAGVGAAYLRSVLKRAQ